MSKENTPKKQRDPLDIKALLTQLRDDPEAKFQDGLCKTTQVLRVNLTDPERLSYGSELAQAQSDLRQLEEDKKSVTSEFGARIASREASMTQIANRIRMGYEMREVKCCLVLEDPAPGRKTTYRLDTLEAIETREMTDEEKQRNLPLEPVTE